jgi:hypothetical protein
MLNPTCIAIKRTSVVINRPTLAISLSGTNVVLSWSTAAANFNLQSATNLANRNWLPVVGTIYTNGGTVMLTNPISGLVHFYRLSYP